MPPLLLALVFNRVETAPMPFFVRPVAKGIARRVRQSFIDPQLATHLGYMESEIAKTPWFAGRGVHRGRRANELSAGGRELPRRAHPGHAPAALTPG